MARYVLGGVALRGSERAKGGREQREWGSNCAHKVLGLLANSQTYALASIPNSFSFPRDEIENLRPVTSILLESTQIGYHSFYFSPFDEKFKAWKSDLFVPESVCIDFVEISNRFWF